MREMKVELTKPGCRLVRGVVHAEGRVAAFEVSWVSDVALLGCPRMKLPPVAPYATPPRLGESAKPATTTVGDGTFKKRCFRIVYLR